jgi:hypothetical protein
MKSKSAKIDKVALLSPHGSDETLVVKTYIIHNYLDLLSPHGSDETKKEPLSTRRV